MSKFGVPSNGPRSTAPVGPVSRLVLHLGNGTERRQHGRGRHSGMKSRRALHLKLAGIVTAIVIFILVPYFLWHERMDAYFASEAFNCSAPDTGNMEVLRQYGTPEQKEQWLKPLLNGEIRSCFSMTEPQVASSDATNIECSILRDGDEYVINGSKIWTTGAQHANKMFCLVRTASESKPQAGITFVLLDMNSEGVTVDPIVSLDGEVEQGQVFFEDVRVPKSNRIGEENQGWSIAKFLLEFERGGSSYNIFIERQLATIYALIEEQRAMVGETMGDDPLFASRLVELEIDSMALKFLEHRITAAAAGGGNPGALASMQKIVGSELSQRIDELSLELQGTYGAVKQNEALKPGFTDAPIGCESGVKVMNHYLNNRAATIFGGTSEIQRNIIAKMVLGL